MQAKGTRAATSPRNEDDWAWVGPFVRQYYDTIRPHDWDFEPTAWRAFVGAWQAVFARHKVTREESQFALSRLAGYPPAFREKHLPAVVAVVEGQRREARSKADLDAAAKRKAHNARHWAKRQLLEKAWSALSAEEQAMVRGRVLQEAPWANNFPSLLRLLCLGEIDRATVGEQP